MGRGPRGNKALSFGRLASSFRSIGRGPSPAYGPDAVKLSDSLRQSFFVRTPAQKFRPGSRQLPQTEEQARGAMTDFLREVSPQLKQSNYQVDLRSLRALQFCARWSHDNRPIKNRILTDSEANTLWLMSTDQGGRSPNINDERHWNSDDRVAYGHLLNATGMGRFRLCGAASRLEKELLDKRN